jgi:hypothetical protein
MSDRYLLEDGSGGYLLEDGSGVLLLEQVVFTGTGGIVFAKPALAGSGAETFTGSGSVTISRPSFAGSGAEGFTGSGGVAFARPSLAGSGTETFAGTGSVTFAKPALAGTGNVGAVSFTGTGGVTFGPPSLAGTGTITGGVVVITQRHGGRRLPAGAARVVGPAIPRIPRQLLPEPPQIVITGSGGVIFARPSLAGIGEYNDDELALEMLLLEAA